jgi:hypothetical protein
MSLTPIWKKRRAKAVVLIEGWFGWDRSFPFRLAFLGSPGKMARAANSCRWFGLSIGREVPIFSAQSLISSDGLRPEGSISRKATMAGTAVGRGTFSARQARPPRPALSKDGDQANHETSVRGKLLEPGGGRLCPVALGSFDAGLARALARAGCRDAGSFLVRHRQSRNGQSGDRAVGNQRPR